MSKYLFKKPVHRPGCVQLTLYVFYLQSGSSMKSSDTALTKIQFKFENFDRQTKSGRSVRTVSLLLYGSFLNTVSAAFTNMDVPIYRERAAASRCVLLPLTPASSSEVL